MSKLLSHAIAGLAASLTLLTCSPSARAADYRMLPLHKEGQASVTIDDGSKTAFVVDLGKAGDGDKISLEGRPLLEYLSEVRKTENLVFTCSHPHADHMGGIRAIFKDPIKHLFINGDHSRPAGIGQLGFGRVTSSHRTAIMHLGSRRQLAARRAGRRLHHRHRTLGLVQVVQPSMRASCNAREHGAGR